MFTELWGHVQQEERECGRLQWFGRTLHLVRKRASFRIRGSPLPDWTFALGGLHGRLSFWEGSGAAGGRVRAEHLSLGARGIICEYVNDVSVPGPPPDI